MKPNQNQLRELFEKYSTFQVKNKKGFWKDTVYRGMLKDDLNKLGYSIGYLRKAERKGILETFMIDPTGRLFRSGYLYKGQNLGKNKIALALQRWYNYLRGVSHAMQIFIKKVARFPTRLWKRNTSLCIRKA